MNKKGFGVILKKYYKQILIAIGFFIVLLSILLIGNFIKKEMNELKIENVKMYQYFGTQRFDYETSLIFNRENEITELKVNNETVTLDSTPFYYSLEKKVMFPQTMSVVFPKSGGIQNKIKYFTYIDGTGLDNYIKNDNLNYLVSNVFLYDGNDLYFFLEPTTIKFNDVSVEIPAFSYAIYNYNNELYIYNYDMNVVNYYENVTSDVIATNENYEINLKIDSLIMGEKTRLLMKNLEFLDSLK